MVVIMELSAIINGIIAIFVTAITGVFSYFFKKNDERITKLEDTLKSVQIEVPSAYVKRDELFVQLSRVESKLDISLQKIDEKLDKISDKLDRKQDK